MMRSPDRPLHVDVIALSMARVSAATLQQFADVCDPHERERSERFVFGRDRDLYLLAHGLLRMSLTRWAPWIEPRAWRFETEEFGRPFIASPRGTSIDFNISHCPGRVMCVISRGHRCGVDVEAVSLTSDIELLAASVLAQSERDWLDAGPAGERPIRFLRLWTMKEAIAKATGHGLRLSFDDIQLNLSDEPVLLRAPSPCGAIWALREGSSIGYRHAIAIKDVNPARVRFTEIEADTCRRLQSSGVVLANSADSCSD